jgi:hypothetical protein
MLPLAFAALVWPSRRVWAVRAVELLVALILSKLAIVAVLELGGAALDQLGHHGLGGIMASLSGTALLLLAGLSPWAVLRLVPMAELASGAVDSVRASAAANYRQVEQHQRGAEHKLAEVAASLAAWMRAEAHDSTTGRNGADDYGRQVQAADAAERNGARPCAGTDGSQGSTDARAGGAGEREGSTGSDGADGQGGGTSVRADERLPGLGPMFQAPNGSWRPLTLGPDGEWPPARLWPPDETSAASADQPGPSPDGERPGEDHDPLPAPQEKPEGSL